MSTLPAILLIPSLYLPIKTTIYPSSHHSHSLCETFSHAQAGSQALSFYSHTMHMIMHISHIASFHSYLFPFLEGYEDVGFIHTSSAS